VAPAIAQQASFWRNSPTPATPAVTDDRATVTLGLQFRSDVPGSVTGVRFYKGPHNTGTHVGNLWSSTGTKLATATFSNETASGWQQVNLPSPVAIAANTPYVISYVAPQGAYADDEYYSWSTVSATPLHVSGSSPGVDTYGSSVFPYSAWHSSNYYVDVIFVAGTPSAPSGTYTISGKVSGSAANLTLSGAASKSTTTDSTGNYSFSGLQNGSYLVAPSQQGYVFSPSTATAAINGASIAGVNFAASAASGSGQTPPPVKHSTSLNWSASVSSNINSYKVYRTTTSGGPYIQIGTSSTTSYVDSSVSSGVTYFYVTTAIDSNNVESGYSNEVKAVVPTP